MSSPSNAALIGRRGELLAELFLTDLGAKVTRFPFDGPDYLVLLENKEKGLQLMTVEVKAIERPLPEKFAANTRIVEWAAKSNIPLLLLVVDVKQNKLGCAWLDEVARELPRRAGSQQVSVPLKDAVKERDSILEHVRSTVLVGA